MKIRILQVNKVELGNIYPKYIVQKKYIFWFDMTPAFNTFDQAERFVASYKNVRAILKTKAKKVIKKPKNRVIVEYEI